MVGERADPGGRQAGTGRHRGIKSLDVHLVHLQVAVPCRRSRTPATKAGVGLGPAWQLESRLSRCPVALRPGRGSPLKSRLSRFGRWGDPGVRAVVDCRTAAATEEQRQNAWLVALACQHKTAGQSGFQGPDSDRSDSRGGYMCCLGDILVCACDSYIGNLSRFGRCLFRVGASDLRLCSAVEEATQARTVAGPFAESLVALMACSGPVASGVSFCRLRLASLFQSFSRLGR